MSARLPAGLRSRVPLLLLGAGLIMATAVQFVSALTFTPVPLTDAVVFIPTAISYRAGEGLTNPLFGYLYLLNADGVPRFTSHAPVFPWLTGQLMPGPDLASAWLVLAAFKTVTLGLLAFLLFRQVPRTAGGRSAGLVAGAVGLVGTGAMFLPPVGRPEILAQALILAAYLILTEVSSRPWRGLLLATGLGLLAATHPVAGLLTCLLYAAWILHSGDLRKALREGGMVGLGSVLVFLAILALSPNGLVRTLDGLVQTGAYSVGRGGASPAGFLRYWFFWWDRAFFGCLYLLLAPAAAWFIVRHLRRGLFLLTCGLILAGIWVFGIKAPPTSYNVAVFFPLAVLATARLIGHFWQTWPDAGRGPSPAFRYGVFFVFLLALALPASALLKFGSEYVGMVRSETTLIEAKAALRIFLERDENEIFFTKGNWALLDQANYGRARDLSLLQEPPGGSLILGGSSVPAALEAAFPGIQLECLTSLDAPRPTLFGYPVSHFPSGFTPHLYAVRPRPEEMPSTPGPTPAR